MKKRIFWLGGLLLFVLLVVAATPTIVMDSLPQYITNNTVLSLTADFSDDDGFVGDWETNQFLLRQNPYYFSPPQQSVTFNATRQVVYVRLPQLTTISSATFDILGDETVHNISLYVGENNNQSSWNYEGDLSSTVSVNDFSSDLNGYISSYLSIVNDSNAWSYYCTNDWTRDPISRIQYGINFHCLVPLTIISSGNGTLNISNLNITYSYNNSCERCIAKDGHCDTEWINTTTRFTNRTTGTCSYHNYVDDNGYWFDPRLYNNSNYEIGFRIKNSNGEVGTTSQYVLLNRILISNYSTNTNLARIGDTIMINTSWISQSPSTNYNRIYSLYVNDNLSQIIDSSRNPFFNFTYIINSNDYPLVSFQVHARDNIEKSEGFTPLMDIRIGLDAPLTTGIPTEFNFSTGNVTLLLNSSVNGIISVLPENPESSPSDLTALKGLDIEVDDETQAALQWALIKIPYDDSELAAANIEESTLQIYYFNGTDWILEQNQGVDTTNNQVWANVTHFSVYGAFGSAPTTPASSSSGGSSGGGGGGGSSGGSRTGGTPTPATTNLTYVPPAKTETPVPVEKTEAISAFDTTSSLLTGAATADTSSEKNNSLWTIVGVAVIVLAIGYRIIRRKKKTAEVVQKV